MKNLILFIFCLSFAINLSGQEIQPPIPNKIPHEVNINGNIRIDNYYWLKEKDSSRVIQHLIDENKYANANVLDTSVLAKKLLNELSQEYFNPPYIAPRQTDSVHNGIILFNKNGTSNKYPYICKRFPGTLYAYPLLDLDSLSKGHKYFDYKLKYSPDYKILAYLIDTSGAELYYCNFINVITGKPYNEAINNITSYCEWANDNLSFLYVTVNPVDLRWEKINLHELGNRVQKDKIVYYEKNPNCHTYVTKDETNRLLIINSESRNGFSQQYIDALKPNDKLKSIHPFVSGLIFNIKPFANKIYILTNYKALNFRILETSLSAPASLDSCKEILSSGKDGFIQDFHLCSNFLIIEERKQGIPAISIFNLLTGNKNYIDFPDANYSIYLNDIIFNSDTIEINYSSPVTPKLIIKYCLKNGSKKNYSYSLTDTSIYNPTNYILKVVYSQGTDGIKVPITLFYKKALLLNGNNPLLMEGYGAYGSCQDVGFSSFSLSLVNRGFVYAIAHIRGGGEFGESWHEQGSGLNKKNAVDDFINCSKYLIQKGYTSPNNFFITGGSAGGVIVGGAIVFHPELYRAALLRVPFLDVVTTMSDSTLPGVKIENEEWGDPTYKDKYDYMLSYSPYDNIQFKNFPSVFIRSSYNDSRVMYWEAAKFTAKLREHQQLKGNKILLLTNMNGGHLRRNFMNETAGDYAYLLNIAGINK